MRVSRYKGTFPPRHTPSRMVGDEKMVCVRRGVLRLPMKARGLGVPQPVQQSAAI